MLVRECVTSSEVDHDARAEEEGEEEEDAEEDADGRVLHVLADEDDAPEAAARTAAAAAADRAHRLHVLGSNSIDHYYFGCNTGCK